MYKMLYSKKKLVLFCLCCVFNKPVIGAEIIYYFSIQYMTLNMPCKAKARCFSAWSAFANLFLFLFYVVKYLSLFCVSNILYSSYFLCVIFTRTVTF